MEASCQIHDPEALLLAHEGFIFARIEPRTLCRQLRSLIIIPVSTSWPLSRGQLRLIVQSMKCKYLHKHARTHTHTHTHTHTETLRGEHCLLKD